MLIVGAGLAGTCLSLQALEMGFQVTQVSDPLHKPQSLAAAGLINPITGKRFQLSWEAGKIFPIALSFYEKWESELGALFLHKQAVFKPFPTQHEANDFIAKSESAQYRFFLEKAYDSGSSNTYWLDPFGGFLTRHSGWLNVPLFLSAAEGYLSDKVNKVQEAFSYEALVTNNPQINYKAQPYDSIVFAEGYRSRFNPFFTPIPVGANKGETILVEGLDNWKEDQILNKSVFVIPVGEKQFRVGATYKPNEINIETTAEAREELEARLMESVRLPFDTIAQFAGIRPTSPDRKPIIGQHPTIPSMWMLNGLGSKGVSYGPWAASLLLNALASGMEIPDAVNIKRYYSLY